MRRLRQRVVAAGASVIFVVATASTTGGAPLPKPEEDRWLARRAALVREVETSIRRIAPTTGIAQLDPRVRDALLAVPRHAFVPEAWREYAYEDRPLAIGHEQTISQPSMVALMTQLAAVDPGDRVLEIGTGSGYQAAVLAELVENVYTVEIVEPLARRAAAVLAELGYDGVVGRVGDGWAGWPEHAPFDAIVVTAAPETVPRPLVDQLAKGGKLVIPVGPDSGPQELLLVEKDADGTVHQRSVLPVAFVPFTGDHGGEPTP